MEVVSTVHQLTKTISENLKEYNESIFCALYRLPRGCWARSAISVGTVRTRSVLV